MTGILEYLRRRRRSVSFRARIARRKLRNAAKRFHKSIPVTPRALSDISGVCDSKDQLFSSTADTRWCLAATADVPCTSLKAIAASTGTRNRDALAASLSGVSFDTSEILVGRFHNCIAEPLSVRLVTQDRNLIIETCTVHDSLDTGLVDTDHLAIRNDQRQLVARNYRFVDHDVLFAFNSFSPSYGHYLLTSLPLIFSFSKEISRGALKVVMPADFPAWMKDHLLELGLSEHNVLILPNSSYRFRSALASNILDARNTRAPNPFALSWIERLLDRPTAVRASSPRLYVRRTGPADLSSRTIRNEAELIAALATLGFVAIEPAKMSLREQARAFRAADVIVSPHGSTLANLLFCRTGTKVLDLMPDDWVGARASSIRDMWGLRICSLARLEYSVLLCPSQITARHHSGNPTIEYSVSITDALANIKNIVTQT